VQLALDARDRDVLAVARARTEVDAQLREREAGDLGRRVLLRDRDALLRARAARSPAATAWTTVEVERPDGHVVRRARRRE
jgi:hypothetical protein